MSEIVWRARALCDEIAGELPEGEYRGSIEIVTVLFMECVRLREHIKYGSIYGHETRYPEKDSTGSDIRMVKRSTGRTIPDLTKREHVCEWQGRIVAQNADTVPRSRLNAVEAELKEANEKLATIWASASKIEELFKHATGFSFGEYMRMLDEVKDGKQ